MAKESTERTRMMIDLPAEVQMAIKLRAVKRNVTTGAVVALAMTQAFGEDVEEALSILAEQKKSRGKVLAS